MDLLCVLAILATLLLLAGILWPTPPQLPIEPFPLNTDVAPAPVERHDDGTVQGHSHDEWRHLPEGQ